MSYKRLTEGRGNLIIDKCSNCENVSNPMGCTDKNCYEVMKKRLYELENKIEQGTLVFQEEQTEKLGKPRKIIFTASELEVLKKVLPAPAKTTLDGCELREYREVLTKITGESYRFPDAD